MDSNRNIRVVSTEDTENDGVSSSKTKQKPTREHREGHGQRTLEEEAAIGNSEGIRQAVKEAYQGSQEYLCCICGKGVCSNVGDRKQALGSENHCTTSYVILAESTGLSEPQFLHLNVRDRNPCLTGLLQEVNGMTRS